MKSANPLKGAFQSNDDVKLARHELHETIVNSVNDMLVLTAKKEHSCKHAPRISHRGALCVAKCLLVSFISGRGVKQGFSQRAKDRAKDQDIDPILQPLSDKTRGLKEAIEDAQNQSIESIDVKTTYAAVGTAHVLQGVSHLGGKVDVQNEELHSVSIALQEQYALLKALFEAQSNQRDEIAHAHLKSADEEPSWELSSWYIRKLEDMFFTNKSMFAAF